MFLNLKDENSRQAVGNDGWIASNGRFDGGTGELDDVAAAEKPFMNCSLLSIVYLTQFSAYMKERKGPMRTLRMLDGRLVVTLRGSGKGQKTSSGV